jgi:hypothetical protein
MTKLEVDFYNFTIAPKNQHFKNIYEIQLVILREQTQCPLLKTKVSENYIHPLVSQYMVRIYMYRDRHNLNLDRTFILC